MHGKELNVYAGGKAVRPLAHGAAHFDGPDGGVDELLAGLGDAGGELVVEHVGYDAADLVLRLGLIGEGLSVLWVGDLLHECFDDRVQVALRVDVDARALERAGETADHILLRLGGKRRLVLPEAPGGLGVDLAPPKVAFVV